MWDPLPRLSFGFSKCEGGGGNSELWGGDRLLEALTPQLLCNFQWSYATIVRAIIMLSDGFSFSFLVSKNRNTMYCNR